MMSGSRMMSKQHSSVSDARAWLRWPVLLIANLAILFFVGVSTVRESARSWTVDREIHALESQAVALEGRKLQLAQIAQELSSPERVELEARRLGWKKEGERVFVLSGYETGRVESDTGEVALNVMGREEKKLQTSDAAQGMSNPQLWLQYFFEHR